MQKAFKRAYFSSPRQGARFANSIRAKVKNAIFIPAWMVPGAPFNTKGHAVVWWP